MKGDRMKTVITSVGSYIPKRRVTNDELAEHINTSDEWIRSHTGIGARHIAEDDEASSDLGYRAALDAIERAGLQVRDIGGIITATATPDHPGFPSTACIIQDKLKAQPIWAFDIAAGCSGFIYGIEAARGMLQLGSTDHILVIGTEKLTSVVDWNDRNCVLFGDAAGAVIVSASTADDEGRGILCSELHADGAGADALIVSVGGSRHPMKNGYQDISDITLRMQGRRVYNFAVSVLVSTLKSLLEKTNLTIDDISYIVPHQANIRIIQAAAKRLGFPNDKFYVNIENLANTSAASIPVALREMEDTGLLKKGDIIAAVGFGAGLTYGGNIIVW